MADQELDLRGLFCPIPVMRVKEQLDQMSNGQTLSVLASDPGTVMDFKAFAKKTGNKLLESTKIDEGNFKFLLKKG
jgi:tRNA 2-thiouridine synthesizing protein A